MPETSMNDQVSELLYRRLKAVQRDFGLARLELGTLLEVFRNNEALWKGRAETFQRFLEEERIQSNGASQFMRVAKKFVLELGLNDAELAELATVNFRTLDMAISVVNADNKDEILSLVTALGERDARAALEELVSGAGNESAPGREEVPKQVKSLIRRFRELPDDYRLEFMQQLQTKPKGANFVERKHKPETA